MGKTVLILVDGLADEPLAELGGKTPLEAAATPNMDAIARAGAGGTFLSLPEPFPNSSDVANMSVLGYDLPSCYTGRGALEALSQGIDLAADDVAFRCNLVTVRDDTLIDYSAGHIDNATAEQLIAALAENFNSPEISFHSGVSYRHLLILHGPRFTDRVRYEKPDANQDGNWRQLQLRPADPDDPAGRQTADILNQLQLDTHAFLADHPANAGRDKAANLIWPWSPGRRPAMPAFADKYGVRGAIISAVDVIFGLGIAAGMTPIRVPGATGFIDSNFEGKADAAASALADYDFVYLHVEAVDECGHLGDLDLKMQAIETIDRRLIGRLRAQLAGQEVTLALLPDHPVPVRKRVHTRDPVPVAIRGPHLTPDGITAFSERLAPTGSLGAMAGDQLMRRILG